MRPRVGRAPAAEGKRAGPEVGAGRALGRRGRADPEPAAIATLYFGIVAGVYTSSPGNAVRHAPWEVAMTIVFFALASLFGILSNMSGFAHRDQSLDTVWLGVVVLTVVRY